MRAGISGTVARSVGAIRDRAVIRASRPMRSATSPTGQDRKSVGEGKRGDIGGGPINKKKKKIGRMGKGSADTNTNGIASTPSLRLRTSSLIVVLVRYLATVLIFRALRDAHPTNPVLRTP